MTEISSLPDQRLSATLVSIILGLSVLLSPILKQVPFAVLFGVFLYMGVQSLKGQQFFDRILLLFIPHKHQPDYVFLKYVPLRRVHMFTFIQLVSLVGLWVIKSNPTTSIAFPVRIHNPAALFNHKLHGFKWLVINWIQYCSYIEKQEGNSLGGQRHTSI